MTLYRYLPLPSALKSLQSENLKFGLMKDFNDPFEFLHRFEEDETPQRRLELMRHRKINETDGFICFSHEDTLSNPLLWSHYADHHRGVALGFEFNEQDEVTSPVGTNAMAGLEEAHAIEIKYRKDLEERVDISNIPLMDLILPQGEAAKLWYTKGESWAYEKEWRVRYPLDSTIAQNGFHFVSIKKTPPTEIILGWKCKLLHSYFNSLLKEIHSKNSNWGSTKVLRMRPHTKQYSLEVIHDTSKIIEAEDQFI